MFPKSRLPAQACGAAHDLVRRSEITDRSIPRVSNAPSAAASVSYKGNH